MPLPVLALVLLSVTGAAAHGVTAARFPDHFGIHHSGAPCPSAFVDRTYSQFQVNLSRDEGILTGALVSAPDGEALLARDGMPPVRLVTNASRADWLLGFPLLMNHVGVHGRNILRPDCSTESGTFYVESIYPPVLLHGPIDDRLDLMRRMGAGRLQAAVIRYRRSLGRAMGAPRSQAGPRDRMLPAASSLSDELFEPGSSMGLAPWRVRLLGGDDALAGDGTVEILLSGSDGAVGVFGHIAAGGAGRVYNVYPQGSDRGASGPVHIADYLFHAQRGHALRRPTWILRLEGLPSEVARAFHEDIGAEVEALESGRVAYHPTANNCTIVSLRALSHLGFQVGRARYFTRRFPRPAFTKILSDLPHLIAGGRLQVRRAELIYVPQVPTRPLVGGAPNRPLRDRSKVGAS